jgi:hypothetical protein
MWSADNISLLRSLPDYLWSPFVYKHFVPPGLRTSFSRQFVCHGHEQHTNGAVPTADQC